MARKQYVRHTRAWYHGSIPSERTEEFNLSNDSDDDYQEFTVAWYGNIVGLENAPKVEGFHDAFFFLRECMDMIVEMHGDDTTPDEFEEILSRWGWVDVTPTVNPYTTSK